MRYKANLHFPYSPTNSITPQFQLELFHGSDANIYLAGPHYLQSLGIPTDELLSSNKRVTAVSESLLTCEAWLQVQYEINSNKANKFIYLQ